MVSSPRGVTIPVSLLGLGLSVAGLEPLLSLFLSAGVIPVSLLVDVYSSCFTPFGEVSPVSASYIGVYMGVGRGLREE